MIAYSHVNEDNFVDGKVLIESEANNCIAVAGSGERVLSLLNSNCKRFVFLDVNPDALYLTRLKIALLKNLSVTDYLSMVGYDNKMSASERIELYSTLSNFFSDDLREYWDKNKQLIGLGILNAGEFEQFLKRIRPMLTIFLGRKFLKEVTEGTYNFSLLDRLRWKIVSTFFRFKWVYQLFGNKDEAFVGSGAEISIIPEVLSRQIKNKNAHISFMTHLIFNGGFKRMKKENLPDSVNSQVLETIKSRLVDSKVELSFELKDLKEYIEEINVYDTMISTSDVLSFVPFDYVESMLEILARKGNTVVLRAFIRNRLTESELTRLSGLGYHPIDLSKEERTGMYKIYLFK